MTLAAEDRTRCAREVGEVTYVPARLVIPRPRSVVEWLTLDARDRWRPEIFESACRRIRIAVAEPAPDDRHVDAPAPLVWYRWIVGHQVSFMLWQLLAGAFGKAARDPTDQQLHLRAMTQYVRGYSGMLLYSGSCSQATYREVLRPSMASHHPAFSGSWARDFQPAVSLFRGRLPAWPESAALGDLKSALRLAQTVHVGVAAKLVPNGPSLLQQAHSLDSDREVLAATYDRYFLTTRAPVPLRELIVQLVSLCAAINRDVGRHGLHLTRMIDRPPQLASVEVLALERELLMTNYLVARVATGLGDDGGVSP